MIPHYEKLAMEEIQNENPHDLVICVRPRYFWFTVHPILNSSHFSTQLSTKHFFLIQKIQSSTTIQKMIIFSFTVAALLGTTASAFESTSRHFRSLEALTNANAPTYSKRPWWDLGLADDVLNEVRLI